MNNRSRTTTVWYFAVSRIYFMKKFENENGRMRTEHSRSENRRKIIPRENGLKRLRKLFPEKVKKKRTPDYYIILFTESARTATREINVSFLRMRTATTAMLLL